MRQGLRRVRDEGEARNLLAQQRLSGLSLRDWCNVEGIKAHSLAWWKIRLQDSAIRLVEVTPMTPPAAHPEARYIVHVGDLAIEVSDDFKEDTLGRLLDVLSRC
jgi:hypothetical protein